jgi:hypothetical protein
MGDPIEDTTTSASVIFLYATDLCAVFSASQSA